MSMKDGVRQLLHRVGVDVVRYPLASPLARTVRLLHHHGVECVLDVGANSGGFSTAIRHLGFSGRIMSFEPLQVPYDALHRKADADGNWDAFRIAVGDTQGDLEINVSGNSGLSSSALPMLERHEQAAPSSRYVGSEIVRQDRLDNLLPGLGVSRDVRSFLKVDVQGYEKSVLDGASKILASGSIIGLQLELSLVPLYRGAMTYRDGLDFAEQRGMTLMGIDPVLADPTSGQLLQVDAVFFA